MDSKGDMLFEQLNHGSCKTYLVGSAASRQAALIDPLIGSVSDYLRILEEKGFELRYVVDTHTHADHISGARLVAERTGAECAMHRKAGARHAGIRIDDGSTLEVGDLRLDVIETPGHTKDSVSILVAGRLLTGDWLFIGGAGRTDLPGGDPGEHWDSLQRVIPSLDEATRIYPGHDYRDRSESRLVEEKRTNANLQPRSRSDYVRWLSSGSQPTPEWMIQTIRANNEGPTDPTLDFMPADASAACMCQPPPSVSVAEIAVDEVHSLARSDERPFLLDVRQPEEYVGPLGHVPGAVLVPLGELAHRLAELEPHRDRTIVAICRSGSRSARAAEILTNAGFEKVLNMTGGTLAWKEKGLPLER